MYSQLPAEFLIRCICGWFHTQFIQEILNRLDSLKFIYSENATKFCEIFTLLLTGTTQDKGEDFAKFCGLLRIYELQKICKNILLRFCGLLRIYELIHAIFARLLFIYFSVEQDSTACLIVFVDAFIENCMNTLIGIIREKFVGMQ